MTEPARFAVGVPAPQTITTQRGSQLAYQRFGMGPPVIALHATGHGGGDYLPLAKRLRGHELIVVDWPGHGRSQPDGVAPRAKHYADLVKELVNQLELAPPVLIGNSIGGAAALEYAARHPVRALVLCNPGGLAPVDGLARAFIGAMVRFFRAGERGSRWFKPAFALYCRLILRTAAARSQRERMARAGYELASLVRQAWEGFAEPGSDLRQLAAGLRVPVLFAWARHDRIIALHRSMRAVRAVPRHELALFDGGHAAFLEQPDAFAERLQRFLDAAPAQQSLHQGDSDREPEEERAE